VIASSLRLTASCWSGCSLSRQKHEARRRVAN
jgi:hypothetical protein